jgi:hypothetical protein
MARLGISHGWVGLAEALAALCENLEMAWRDGTSENYQPDRVLLKMDPIEFIILYRFKAHRRALQSSAATARRATRRYSRAWFSRVSRGTRSRIS